MGYHSETGSTSDTDYDDDMEGGFDLEGLEFPAENPDVPEDDVLFLKEDQKTQELLNWFHEAMDKGNATHAIAIRKKVRDQLHRLEKREEEDPRFQVRSLPLSLFSFPIH